MVELLKSKEGKIKFGLSFYTKKADRRLGMEVKSRLKEQGKSARLVTSKEKTLSAVVITKNKCQDFMVLPDNTLAQTCAVQDFEDYSKRDYGRPGSDPKSGMLPPKLAKMMINLSQVKPNETLLDPFCGSGTVITEALVMGQKDLLGFDVNKKAVDDTLKNIEWVAEKYNLKEFKCGVEQNDVFKLSSKLKKNSVDVIVTEPFLGPPLRGGENDAQMAKTLNELDDLYRGSLAEFKKVLKPGGRVVMIIPSFSIKGRTYELPLINQIENDWKVEGKPLSYAREGQKVIRNIWQLTN
tara:strand:- start:359 stop:1246 length:888 start_codon:yes stop_codon:yes gene_type:complete